MAINVSIIGASGYAGQELIRILLRHPNANITAITSRKYAGKRLADIYFQFIDTEYASLKFTIPDVKVLNAISDVVFLAVPHAAAMNYVKALTCRVIDLSADYRLKDKTTYEKWYLTKHIDELGLKTAVYGLSEIYESEISNARLIANPGCYPTSVLLPLIPLAKNNVIKSDIFINSFSGMTGAGSAPSENTHFGNLNENLIPYNIGKHRHTPEIAQELKHCGFNKNIVFTPYLLPVDRGILSAINIKSENITKSGICEIYDAFYKKSRFVKFNYGRFPNIKMVRNTNKCIFGVEILNKSNILIISVIDNIIKGAAGQAIQNMNLMFGFDETLGLTNIAFI